MRKCKDFFTNDCSKTNTKVGAKIYFGTFSSFGVISHVSESCMCIDTRMCLPLHSVMHLFIHSKRNTLHVPVQVSNCTREDGLHSTLIVEVLNASMEYLEFINNCKPSPEMQCFDSAG